MHKGQTSATAGNSLISTSEHVYDFSVEERIDMDGAAQLSAMEDNNIATLLNKYASVLPSSYESLPKMDVNAYSIQLKSGTMPIWTPPFWRSPQDMHLMQGEIDKLEAAGIMLVSLYMSLW